LTLSLNLITLIRGFVDCGPVQAGIYSFTKVYLNVA
jgi:hypothetical protein